MTRTLFMAIAAATLAATAHAQDLVRTPDSQADDGAGPYPTLLISGATVIDGSGSPPMGPLDILVKSNRISAIAPTGGFADASPDRTIDAKGMFVLPGFVDVHDHNGDAQKAPNAEYVHKLRLAHGITSVRGVAFHFSADDPGLEEARRSARGEITAPRMFPYAVLGQQWGEAYPATEEAARRWVRWAQGRGYHGMKVFNPTPPDILRAALDEAGKIGMGSVAHLGQIGVVDLNGRIAAEAGIGGLTHFYGHFESLLDGATVQDFPADYNYANEQDRFSGVTDLADQIAAPGSEAWDAYIDLLVDNGVTMSPTFNIYSAGRDLQRARTFEWHDRYTLPSLMRFFTPSATNHGSFFFDWKTEDELGWRRFYQPWMQLVRDFRNRGGRVTVGSDSGFIYQTWGFSYIGELEMLQEAGLTPLEVVRAATIDGARELYQARGEAPPFGLVRAGMLADLIVVPENPLANFKTLYGTGHLRLDLETGQLARVGGVRFTIKDGIVYDAPNLLADVAAMVAAEKAK
ncbi:amidohydrolase [Pacificimonas sp. WHA3]|uniref:Amidohydrolase n=1 Tax=Pacificimonas pallii TaxID=2827236 RepID=A0ABS6SCV7_9SPHN|nr:amidohydrolase [Pacificimonas pallii]MBV7256253.1 amidohydrolase [Pacificimonas pallii]